jgi:hypothetical protein
MPDGNSRTRTPNTPITAGDDGHFAMDLVRNGPKARAVVRSGGQTVGLLGQLAEKWPGRTGAQPVPLSSDGLLARRVCSEMIARCCACVRRKVSCGECGGAHAARTPSFRKRRLSDATMTAVVAAATESARTVFGCPSTEAVDPKRSVNVCSSCEARPSTPVTTASSPTRACADLAHPATLSVSTPYR